jgi:hypothetical protein
MQNRILFLLFLFIIGIQSIKSQVFINEISATGTDSLIDYYGEKSDWIELYNANETDFSLLGYSLTDNKDERQKWIVPDIKIPGKSFLIIFASGNDTSFVNEWHTNFKISKDGESLFLVNPLGTIVDSSPAKPLNAIQSLARILDGSGNFAYSDMPTPGHSNQQAITIFYSHPSGFYPDKIELTLATNDSTLRIYYTLNGNTPTSSDLLYEKPILISDKTYSSSNYSFIPTTPLSGESQLYQFIWNEPQQVNKIATIRYAAIKNDSTQGAVHTQTFFIGQKQNNRYSFPVLSLVTDSLNLFDYNTGIYIPGKRFDENGFNYWPDGNYHNNGDAWERIAHLAYFESNGQLAFESSVGIRMRGYGSASYPQKSFNVYFRSEYGQSNIEYPIFNHFGNSKFKRLILRNGGNDFLKSHFKDAMLQTLIKDWDIDLQDYQEAILFINGEYWGIHNIREKFDKYYFK